MSNHTDTEGFKKWMAANELLDDILFHVSSESLQSLEQLDSSNNAEDRFKRITEVERNVQIAEDLKIFQLHKVNPIYCNMCGNKQTKSSSSSGSNLHSEQLAVENENSKRLSDEALYDFAIMGGQNLQFECQVSHNVKYIVYSVVLVTLSLENNCINRTNVKAIAMVNTNSNASRDPQ